MDKSTIYWAAFLLYSITVVGIGFFIFRKEKKSGHEYDNQTFWAAGKGLSGWAIGMSISASMMSISWSCVYGVQLFYWYGAGGAWLLIVPWLITMAGFYLLTPVFRKMQIFSQPELLEKRFGKRTRQLLAPALIFVFTTWAGAEIYAAGITIAPFLNISVPATLFIIALVVALYSFTGGFEAVVSTDKIQFVLVAFFIALISAVGLSAVYEASHSISGMLSSVRPPKNQPGVAQWLSPGLALIAVTFLVYLPGWLVETDVWVRLQAGRSNRAARRGILLAALNAFIFVGLLPLLIGLTALYLYPPAGSEIPARLQDGALIFTVLMQDYSPLWLNVILGIGLIAAAMSTVDTCGNIVALSISYDLVEPQLRKKWEAPRLNLLARWTSMGAIFLAFIYALFTESLWDIFYLSSGILTTTVFLPVVAAFHPKTTARQVQLSIILGFAGTIIFYLLDSRHLLQHIQPDWLTGTGLGYILWGFLCGALGFVTGYFFPHMPGRHRQEENPG